MENVDSQLLNRRVEVFWEDENDWFSGVVVAKGKAPTVEDKQHAIRGTEGFGWKIRYDDGDIGWIPRLRGNRFVRFLGFSTVTQRDDVSAGSQKRSSGKATKSSSPAQPRFQQQTASSTRFKDSRGETDEIRRAFQPHNYSTLAKLPHRMEHDSVHTRKRDVMRQNREGSLMPQPRHTSLSTHGLFRSFEYISDVNENQGLPGQDKDSKPKFACAGSAAKLKYEDPFSVKPSGKDNASFPYMSYPFEAAEDQERRVKWIEQSKILHGPMLLSSVCTYPTRKELPEMVSQLHGTLKRDWSDANFSVMVDEEDHIIARFERRSIDCITALKRYMDTIALDNSSKWLVRYQLTRVLEDWATQDKNGYIFFMFRPPWVRSNKLHPYLTLHKEERTVKDSLARLKRGGAQ